MKASKSMQQYLQKLEYDVKEANLIAEAARKKGFDPSGEVEIVIAKNVAEQVIGLVSVVAPQLRGSGVTKRIQDLEDKYGALDWRVAMQIAVEIAQEKFCKFKDKIQAMEVGIRTGFTYITFGVVSSPLDGFTNLEIKRRRDGKEYFCIHYSGPIRNAGGTMAAVSVLIADYVRQQFNYDKYDPDEKEQKRTFAEITDYHEWVTNLQYFPSEEEMEFLMQNLAVEISGDPSEKYEVSNVHVKDLPRVNTNRIRSGFCLIHSSCLPLKAPKIWAKLSKFKDEFGINDWDWLPKFIDIQKKNKAKGKKTDDTKIKPDFTYITDIVAGRPVLGHPLRPGGFRLRYGRSRVSGFSGQAINPATMHALNDFIGCGTQCKVERPGKGTVVMPCDTIEGPIVKLEDESVVKLRTEKDALKYKKQIAEILYLGDILINYGDFFDRAHPLVPMGYVPEYWILQLEEASIKLFGTIDEDKISELTSIDAESISSLRKNPLTKKITYAAAKKISQALNIPLHPSHIFYYDSLTVDEAKYLTRIRAQYQDTGKVVLKNSIDIKNILEKIGIPHIVFNKEFLIIQNDEANAFRDLLHQGNGNTVTEVISDATQLIIKEKGGTYIGARMGRPEKAKMRKMQGQPHTLFPVGDEGGRLRSFQSVLEKGFVTGDFGVFYCKKCNESRVLQRCYVCKSRTVKAYHCDTCGIITEQCTHEAKKSTKQKLDIRPIWDYSLKKLKTKVYPDLIKGVRGTINTSHIPEHPIKGMLRAKHNIFVNKDGTTRYDCSEITLTHFKPKEVRATVQKLIDLGYATDINGKPLVNDNQVLELKPQDVVLPACLNSPDEPSDEVLFRITKYIDELLVSLYGLKPYYNLETKEDLIGELIIGLAPHTSTGTVGRIIGFSKTQGFLAHPYYHAAMRRDCFTKDTRIPIFNKGTWKLELIGELVETLNPKIIVDNYGTKEVKISNYKTLGYKNGVICPIKINNFTKHAPRPIIRIETSTGRILSTTPEHKHLTKDGIKQTIELTTNDLMKIPYESKIPKKEIKHLDLIQLLKNEEWVMVKDFISSKKLSINYKHRKCYPLNLVFDELETNQTYNISAKRDNVIIPSKIEVNEEFLKILGLYVAEGYSRMKNTGKGYYQIYIAAENEQVRAFVRNYFHKYWGLKPSENKKDRITYSSRILYTLFNEILQMGASAYEKRLPSKFLNLPNEQLGYLLSGYFEGDGSVSKTDLRLTFDTVSEGLKRDIEFVLSQLKIFVKYKTTTRIPGKKLQEFYIKKNKPIPKFTCTKGIIQSKFMNQAFKYIFFISDKKQNIMNELKNKQYRNIFLEHDEQFIYDKIVSIKNLDEEITYCLNTENNTVVANGVLTKQCDGDESCAFLLMDGFLNFSKSFLPETRGGTMDAPLVLTYNLDPSGVDDMVFNLDTEWNYPLKLYSLAENYKMPWDINIERIQHRLGTESQFEGMGFTHDTDNFNSGVFCSAYKLLPSMREKLEGQMDLAVKIRAVDSSDVARNVIEKHFMRDIRGNLRKFSMQQYRCVKCNDKYRRPPLNGRCVCGGKIIFTISEGGIIKYLEPAIGIAEKHHVSTYLKQTLELTKRMIEDLFGKDKEKQTGLGDWVEA